jgi:hypothetical protein
MRAAYLPETARLPDITCVGAQQIEFGLDANRIPSAALSSIVAFPPL